MKWTSQPETTADEAVRDERAIETGCPYFWIDGGRYRSLDSCMAPGPCDCWTRIQTERENASFAEEENAQ